MKAKLKRLYSPDVDLPTYHPEEPEKFGFLLQAMIGPEEEEGEDSFGIIVCSVKWFQDHYSEEIPLFGFHFLFVSEYDISEISKKVEKYCEACSGENWLEIAQKLSKIGKWEFEDYNFQT